MSPFIVFSLTLNAKRDFLGPLTQTDTLNCNSNIYRPALYTHKPNPTSEYAKLQTKLHSLVYFNILTELYQKKLNLERKP